MGKMSRLKGQTFERSIATVLRKRFPQMAGDIRRSIQSRQAEESDVTGIPGLWLELQHAANPTPGVKLAQAIHDSTGTGMIPVAITHKTRTKSIEVSMRMKDYVALINRRAPHDWIQALEHGHPVVIEPDGSLANARIQMDWENFLTLIERSEPWLRS